MSGKSLCHPAVHPYNTDSFGEEWDLSDEEWDSSEEGWAYSSLRQWLNETFINLAFTDEERAMIKETIHGVSDKVYIVTYWEMNGYGDYEGYTEYTKKKAGITEESPDNQSVSFWFRSSNMQEAQSCEAQMDRTPVAWEENYIPADSYNGVRPALWISIEF